MAVHDGKPADHQEIPGPRPPTRRGGLLGSSLRRLSALHGANRLGSNSLLDLVVFGRAAGIHLGDSIKPGATQKPVSKNLGDEALDRLNNIRYSKGSSKTSNIRLEMQRAMQENCAVFRTGEILDQGMKRINNVWEEFKDISLTDKSMIWNTDLLETLELKKISQTRNNSIWEK